MLKLKNDGREVFFKCTDLERRNEGVGVEPSGARYPVVMIWGRLLEMKSRRRMNRWGPWYCGGGGKRRRRKEAVVGGLKEAAAVGGLKLLLRTPREIKLKELRKRRKGGGRKKSWPATEDEVELLLGLIDVKVIWRVLRIMMISKEQLFWSEEKMKKLDVSNGKLQIYLPISSMNKYLL